MKTVIKVFSIINLVCLSIMSIIPVFWFYTIPLIIVNALTLKRVKTTMKHINNWKWKDENGEISEGAAYLKNITERNIQT